MFIQTEATPNPATLKFLPGRTVLEGGTLDMRDTQGAAQSPLAERLFGIAGINPANNNYIRGNGFQGMAGWPVNQKLEDLRAAWINESDFEKQKQICRDIQLECFQEVPHWPIGLFYQATAFRSSLDGVLNGMALMYNVKRV